MNRIALGRTMRLWACVVAAAGLLACGPEPQGKTPVLAADPPLDDSKGQGQGPAGGAATTALNRGTAFLKNEKYDEAITELTKAIQTDPKSVQAHYYLALAKEKKGDRAGAEQ